MKLLILLSLAALAYAGGFQIPVKGKTSKFMPVSQHHIVSKKVKAGPSENQTTYYDTFYLAQVSVGTPRQNFTVVLDTGSSDLWVADKTYSGGADKHKFDSSKSSTYKKVGGRFTIYYGSGEVSGFTGSDKMCFGGTTLCVEPQIFGQATQMQVFDQQPVDGLCGMAFQSISAEHTTPPFQNMINQKLVTNPWFTVWLEMVRPTPHGDYGGQFTFGDLDSTNCAATGDWIPLSSATYYEINVDSIGAGSYKTGSTSAISDTGTSFIIGPTDAVTQMASILKGTYNPSFGLYTVDCNAQPPDIVVTINGKAYNIPYTSYIINFGNDFPGLKCALGIAGADMGEPAWILGDVFIRPWCNVYDMGNKRLGLFKALKWGTQ